MSLHIKPLDPASYPAHRTHTGERIWAESNCYVDLWTEVLHANGYEPLACLPFTLSADLEGDQWTFFKFPLADLYRLYGIEVFELNIWRPLLDHVEEQLGLGRIPIIETDGWYLPDTRGTSYRSEHVKTSIGIQMLDRQAGRLGYFHNAGYFELSADDFAGTFRLNPEPGAPNLPLYVEVAKLNARAPLTGTDLVAGSADLLGKQLRRRPEVNPFHRYASRFTEDLAWLSDQPLEVFHRYAFSGLRQCGAAFELAAIYLCWLGDNGYRGLSSAAVAFDEISSMAKALQFKTARYVNTKKPFDPAPTLDGMAGKWDAAMGVLISRCAA